MPNLKTVHYSLIDDNRSLRYILKNILIMPVVSKGSIWVKKQWENVVIKTIQLSVYKLIH